jgi:hypothetical protein
MGDVEFVHSSAGYVALMQSGEMQAVLQSYANGIYSAASGTISSDKGTPLDKAPYLMQSFMGHDRAGVRVQTNNPHARYAEAKYGILQGSAGV